jgi:HAMP domain-containing protein
MQTMRPDAQLPLIQSARAVKTWTDSMMTVGTDGTSVTRDDGRPPTSYADRAWFRAITTGKPIAQQVVLARGGNSGANAPGWVVAVPINGPAGGVVGALVELNTLTQITELLVKQTIGRTGKAMLFAPDGKLIAMTGVAMDKELKDMSSHAAFKAAQSGTDAAHYDNDGRPVLARLKKTQLDWVVAVQMDEEEVMARVRETDAYMLRLLAVAAVLAALFALIVAPGIARPIRSLTKITEEISRGNFEHEISEAKRGDEIGALARSVERMTKSLRIAMTRLADRR